MPWHTWLALGLFVLAVVATGVFAGFAFVRLRELAAFAEGLQARLDEVALAAEKLELRLTEVQGRAEEIEHGKARVEASLERFSVLTWALSDARKDVSRLRRTYLRK